ncbi:MAG: cytochrome-c peroxidase [Saprospiraceae bacterium]
MKTTYLSALAATLLLLSSCNYDQSDSNDLNDELTIAVEAAGGDEGLAKFRMPKSNEFADIPQDQRNPLTPAKVHLGKLLYHETALAIAPMQEIGKGKFSCASCHFASAGFQAGRFQGISEGGTGFGINGEGRSRDNMYTDEEDLDVQPIRTPTAMNGAYQDVMLWNGQFGAVGMNRGTESQWTPETPIAINQLGYEGLETQAIAGLKVHRMGVDMDVLTPLGYKERFDLAFPNFSEEERYSNETAGLAIAAYERTLLANEAPFQKWLKGEKEIMSEQEKRGALVFFDKGNCASCHGGPSLANMEFHALGLNDLIDCPEEVFRVTESGGERKGRGGFTGNPADDYKFKTPQLYNLADSPFYGHGSNFNSLRRVIEYKNAATAQNASVPEAQLAEGFKPLNLTEEEIDDLVVFLTKSLRDNNLMRYQPESTLSGGCIPVNDEMGSIDLGCN